MPFGDIYNWGSGLWASLDRAAVDALAVAMFRGLCARVGICSSSSFCSCSCSFSFSCKAVLPKLYSCSLTGLPKPRAVPRPRCTNEHELAGCGVQGWSLILASDGVLVMP